AVSAPRASPFLSSASPSILAMGEYSCSATCACAAASRSVFSATSTSPRASAARASLLSSWRSSSTGRCPYLCRRNAPPLDVAPLPGDREEGLDEPDRHVEGEEPDEDERRLRL